MTQLIGIHQYIYIWVSPVCYIPPLVGILKDHFDYFLSQIISPKVGLRLDQAAVLVAIVKLVVFGQF